MPEPGCPGFIAKPQRCWRMVYSRQLQATHSHETPSWTGRWFTPKGDRWFRVWAWPEHLEALTGVRGPWAVGEGPPTSHEWGTLG